MLDTKEPKNDDQYQLKVFEDGELLHITIGLELLQHASFTYNPLVDTSEYRVVNNQQFIKDFIGELMREEENGTNFIHHAFDCAAVQMIENGAESIEETK